MLVWFYLMMLCGAPVPDLGGSGSSGLNARKTAAAPPAFAIETIIVEGEKQVPETVILTESRLVAGNTYSEQQLRYAIQRINRLPYVMECDFRLKRGGRRGVYQLVITVVETRFWFVETTSTWQHFSDDGETGNGETGLIGARWFAGPADLFYVSTESQADWREGRFDFGEQLTLGYSHFNLLDENIFFDLQLSWADGRRQQLHTVNGFGEVEIGDAWNLNITTGMPVGDNHWFKLVGRYGIRKDRLWSLPNNAPRSLNAESDLSGGNVTLSWEFNTTDDSFVPRRGRLWRIGFLMGGDQTESGRVAAGSQITESNRDYYNVDFRYQQYIPLWRGHNIGYQSEGGARRDELRIETVTGEQGQPVAVLGLSRELSMNIGGDFFYGADLWSNRKTRRYGDLRLEFRQGLVFLHNNSEFEGESVPFRRRNNDQSAITALEIKYRNAWAVMRLRFQYVWRP